MNHFEQIPKTNKDENMGNKEPSYYEYENPHLLDAVKRFEAGLGDNSEELIKMRGELEERENRLTDIENKEERHACLDKMHAINRKLNQLGHEEE